MANIEKFRDGTKLDNKRLAGEPVRDLVSRAVRRVGPKAFRPLLMPSANMADVDEMTGLGVLPVNMVIVERDRASFEMIGSSVMCPSCSGWVDDTTECRKCGSTKPVGLPSFSDVSGDCLTDSPMELGARLSYETGAFDYMNVDLCGAVSVKQHLKTIMKLAQCFSDHAVLAATAKCAREKDMDQVAALCLKAGKIGLQHDGSNDGMRRLALFAIVVLAPLEHMWRPVTYVRTEYPGDGCHIRMLSYACEYEEGVMDATTIQTLWGAQQDDDFSDLSPMSVTVSRHNGLWRRIDV